MRPSAKGEVSADCYEAGIDLMIELQRSITEIQALKSKFERNAEGPTGQQDQDIVNNLNQRLLNLEDSKRSLSELFVSRFEISPVSA